MRPLRLVLAALPTLLVACGEDAPSPTPADASTRDALTPDASDGGDDAARRWEGPARINVTRYDYRIDLATRAVDARLTLRVEREGDCVTIGFRHPSADAVTFDDAPARDVTVANDTLRACDGRGQGFALGATVTLAVRSTQPLTTWRPTQVGFSTRASATGGGLFTYLLSWVGECARFGPCDATPSAFATYRFTVTHPSGTQVLCPGTVTAGDTETVCDFTHPGGPTYSTIGVMAIANRWRATALGTARGVAVTLHDTPTSRITETIDRPNTLGFLTWMGDTFGAYPYGDALRLVVAPTYWVGFEHPGNIALAETLVSGNRLDHTVRHEVAHQWAGDQTTVATVHDFAWKEAMAEYLAFVYEDERRVRDEARTTLSVWRDAAGRADHYPAPDEDIPLLSYYGSVYGPGPMILFRQVEVMFSRRQVMDALRMLLGRPQALSLDDVRAALEQTTGASLDGYFRAWLRGTGAPAWPGARVTRTAMPDGTLRVQVRVETRDAVIRPCRFRVRLTGDGGEQLDIPVTVGLDGSQPAAVTVRPTFAVTGEVINPEYEALVWPLAPTGTQWIAPTPTPGWDPFRAP